MGNINCGNCKASHSTVNEVRACYGQPPASAHPLSEVYSAKVTAGDRKAEQAATEKQVAFALSLQAERVDENDRISEADYRAMTKAEASKAIEFLLMQPKQAKKVTTKEEPEDGIYIDGDPALEHTIFKVYKMVHGSGRQGVKRLEHGTSDDLDTSGKFGYLGLAVKHLPASARKMTLEEAKEFGRIYGFCVKCGATLTDETSIANGIGPVCGSKGW